MNRILILIMISIIGFGCSRNTNRIFKRKSTLNAGIDSSLLRRHDFSIDFAASGSDQLRITYLGSGGYYIGSGKGAILIDPFFSHHSFLSLPFRKIATRPLDVEFGLSPVLSNLKVRTAGVFVSHSHFDHLMDVPYVFNHFLDATRQSLKIYGSESMVKTISTVVGPGHLRNIEPLIADANSPGQWIYLDGTNLRVLPIKSHHAPHFKRLISLSFYKGKGESIKGYDSDTDKTRPGNWKLGQPLAYLVDVMEGSAVKFRVYIQSSSANFSDGQIPSEVLNQAPTDLAILGAASFSNVDDYPQGLIKTLQPDKIIIGHWEDFFNPYQDSPERTVRFTNIRKFLLKLNQFYPWKVEGEERFFMPEPGVSMEINY